MNGGLQIDGSQIATVDETEIVQACKEIERSVSILPSRVFN